MIGIDHEVPVFDVNFWLFGLRTGEEVFDGFFLDLMNLIPVKPVGGSFRKFSLPFNLA